MLNPDNWNPIKGRCSINCKYCEKHSLNPPRLDEKEFKNITEGNLISVGSSIDMFAHDIPDEWIKKILNHLRKYKNSYIFHSKVPMRMKQFTFPEDSILGTTIETNRYYPEIMGNAPRPIQRSHAKLDFINIEPIMDFDLEEFLWLIEYFNPKFVNIGADTGKNYLPEPNKEKISLLIDSLREITKVNLKQNLKRIYEEN